MINASVDSIIVSWWNTGLTPPVNRNGVKGKRSIVEVIVVLEQMFNSGTKICGLCELSESDLNDPIFIEFLLNNNLELQSFYKKQGNLIWDIIIIFDKTVFTIVDYVYISSSILAEHKKLAVKIDGFINGINIRLYLSHFPGKHTEKEERANMFKDLIIHINTEVDQCDYSIVMGDYNLEICSAEIISSIARSRVHAMNSKKIYSPFMRHLGEKYNSNHHRDISGTFKNKSKWEFYDFISVTKNFFYSDSLLTLNDFKCGIWDELLNNNDDLIDHLPLYITLEQRRI